MNDAEQRQKISCSIERNRSNDIVFSLEMLQEKSCGSLRADVVVAGSVGRRVLHEWFSQKCCPTASKLCRLADNGRVARRRTIERASERAREVNINRRKNRNRIVYKISFHDDGGVSSSCLLRNSGPDSDLYGSSCPRCGFLLAAIKAAGGSGSAVMLDGFSVIRQHSRTNRLWLRMEDVDGWPPN